MRLKTGFLLLAAPPIVLSLALLGSTLKAAGTFATDLGRLRTRGDAVLALHRFAVVLDHELRNTTETVAGLGRGQSRSSGATKRLDSLRSDTRAAFADLQRALSDLRASEPSRASASDGDTFTAADVALLQIIVRADSAVALGDGHRHRGANAVLRRAQVVHADSSAPPLLTRLRAESRAMADGALVLQSTRSAALRVALGRQAAARLDELVANQRRSSDALEFAAAFHALSGEIIGAHRRAHLVVASERARTADAALVSDWAVGSLPAPVVHARRVMGQTLAFADSANAESHESAVATGGAAAIDALPETLLSSLDADLASISARALDARIALVLLAIVIVALAIAASVVFERTVVAPAITLARAANLAGGSGTVDLDPRTEARGAGEIVELQRSFARMTVRLGAMAATQREREQALRERELEQIQRAERSSRLLASAPAVVFTMTVEVQPRITFMSDNAATQTGFPASAFMENPGLFASLVHADDTRLLAAGLVRAVDEGHSVHIQRIRRADGAYRWTHTEIRLVHDEDGVPVEFVGWWIDVTNADLSVPPVPAVFDLARLRENTGNDEDLVHELISIFRSDAPRYVERIRAAVSAGDADAVRCAAHGLKGAAGAVCGSSVAAASFTLEQAGRRGDLSNASGLIAGLAIQVNALDAALAASAVAHVFAMAS